MNREVHVEWLSIIIVLKMLKPFVYIANPDVFPPKLKHLIEKHFFLVVPSTVEQF